MFGNQQLNAPTLNISWSWIGDETLYGYALGEPLLEDMLWVWSNDTYDTAYLTQNGTCQAGRVRMVSPGCHSMS